MRQSVPITGWAASSLRMKSLLLVEDNQDNADLLRDLLSDRYRLAVFPDGPSTLAALLKPEAIVPDLLLLDISLPGLDGTSLLHQIRLLPHLKSVPALALTAHAMRSDRETLIRAGFNGYLSKPIVDEQLLLDAIEAHTALQAKVAA